MALGQHRQQRLDEQQSAHVSGLCAMRSGRRALPLPQQIQVELCARVASLFASEPHCSPVGDKSHDAAQDHRRDVSHATTIKSLSIIALRGPEPR
jgi:hypothetical protein